MENFDIRKFGLLFNNPKEFLNYFDDFTANYEWSTEEYLSSYYHVGFSLVGYLVVMYSINALLGVVSSKDRKKNIIQSLLKVWQLIHNIVMFLLSLVCLVMFVHTAFKHMFSKENGLGFYGVLCDPEHKFNTGKLQFWSYIYFISKYIEFIDTLLIVLRQSRLRFLHTYHHVFTMIIAYYALTSGGTGQWTIISLNTLVHVVMYFYYCLTVFDYYPWWKNHLTDFQLSQFVFDLVFLIYYLYAHYAIEVPKGRSCTGSKVGGMIGTFVIASYFILFLKLRISNTKKKSQIVKKTKKKTKKE